MSRPGAPFVHPGDRPVPGAPRRWRDLAILLPGFGALLFMPPVVALTVPAGTLGNVPVIVIYLFGVWAALILVAALTARALGRGPLRPTRPAPTTDRDPGADG